MGRCVFTFEDAAIMSGDVFCWYVVFGTLVGMCTHCHSASSYVKG